MSRHEHHECDHDMGYCKACDVAYCKKCDKEWRASYGWTLGTTYATVPCTGTLTTSTTGQAYCGTDHTAHHALGAQQ